MTDLLDLAADCTAEERLIRDTAREFVDERVRPDVGDWFEAGEFPTDLVGEMGERDFYAPNLAWGDLPGVSERAYGLLMAELEAGDAAVRSMASVQGALVMWPIHEYGSEAQCERWLPRLAAGDAVGCFGLTEPAHGSNPSAMETSAERDASTDTDGDGFRLSGEKTWITNAPIADVALVWARTDAGDGPVRGFLVETDADGVETDEIDGKLSMRASPTGSIRLDDAFVRDDAVLPDAEGMGGPLSCLTQARYGVAWGAVGAARDCLEVAVEYATDRQQFGRPIGGFQLQQGKLADAVTGVTTGQLVVYRLADLKATGRLEPVQVSLGKRQTVAMARDVARRAREMLGANGITTDYSPMRHLANVETTYTYEGTHDVHSLVLGEYLTGLSAFEG